MPHSERAPQRDSKPVSGLGKVQQGEEIDQGFSTKVSSF